MGKGLPKKYFEDRVERARIKLLVVEAIPADVYYHNIVIALAELTAEYANKLISIKVSNEQAGAAKKATGEQAGDEHESN